jgi:diguanylate cyclase (GGDEF)-like protein
MQLGAIRFPLGGLAAGAADDAGAQLADLTAQLSVLRAVVDDLAVGIVVLDAQRRVTFINRAFRQFWRVPDDMINSELTFARLMYHSRGIRAYAVSHERLGDYVAKQMDLIRTGAERPLQIRFPNGATIQFRCKALPDGGRILTYGNVSELVRQADTFEQLACVDGLTGVNNRRHFLVLADIEWSRFRRYGRPLALLMLDIDRFKSVNDQYGHDVGDAVIKSVAQVLQQHKRTSDVVGRLGGEEFALLLPEATPENAVTAAERFRQLVADCTVSVGELSLSVTVSIGVAAGCQATTSIEELLKDADLALYEAKRSGRNRVCCFAPGKRAEPIPLAPYQNHQQDS